MKLKAKTGKRKLLGSVTNIIILLAIFVIGVNVGSGRLGFHQRQTVARGLPTHLDYSQVDQVYRSLRENYDGRLSESQLLDGLKHGLAQSTKDPYTTYLTAREAKDFTGELSNTFSGVGAQLGQDSEGNLEVIAPLDGQPAAKAGLQAKDIITTINGNSTSGLSVDDAVSRIRGKKDTNVTLQIVRNKSQALSFTITRQDIKLPSVKTKILDGNIGYLQISNFSYDTADLTRKAADSFKKQTVRGVILDLRNNPGGLLDASVKVSSLWLPEGQKILDEKRGGTTVIDSNVATGGDSLRGLPTVVLINAGSASASEIVTGALHDNKAAYVIGEKSYGKGVVQEVICITGARNSDGSCPADELKVTIASWYRPNGQNINHRGITPDRTVKPTAAEAKAGIDTQLQAAQGYLKAR